MKIEQKILNIFCEVFETATSVDPTKGILESAQSRALYAVNLMLEWLNKIIRQVTVHH